MMWDHVMEHAREIILLDPVLSEIFAGVCRKAGVSDLVVPSMEWTLLGDSETELWAPMIVQFDCWTNVASSARTAERRLRGMFHRDLSITFDTYTMFTEYAGGADLATPNRSADIGRAVRFRFTPLRQQYATPGVAS